MEQKDTGVILTDGWGCQITIPKSKIPLAQQRYQEMREIAQEMNFPREIIDKYRIETIEDVK